MYLIRKSFQITNKNIPYKHSGKKNEITYAKFKLVYTKIKLHRYNHLLINTKDNMIF